jgi:hypothetical protein
VRKFSIHRLLMLATRDLRTVVKKMRLRLLLGIGLAALIAGSAAAANSVCTNGQCVTCDGPISCTNGACTCNGVRVTGGGNASVPQGPCGAQETVIHENGGGTVASTASVEASVYVSRDSAICGRANVSGPTRILNGSVVNGHANLSGRSTLISSTVNGGSTVSDSAVTRSTVNGNARVSRSRLVDSTVNGHPVLEDSTVTGSVVNGNASLVGRQIQRTVLNN